MKLVRWLVRLLSGDDDYPLSCAEWQIERVSARFGRRNAMGYPTRYHHGWR